MSAPQPRRAFLCGLAGLPLLSGDAARAAMTIDPIFAPIADVRAWRAKVEKVHDEDRFDRMMSVEVWKLRRLAERQPRTLAGAVEYLQVFADYEGGFLSEPWDSAIASTIAALRGLI